MAMAGLTQPLTGWPVLEEWPMHGLKIPLNGMIQTVMAVVTILQVQLQTFALPIQEPQ
tara:strand:+ start:85 stop:258 length:174 start_codon:yes stop_codon:yes gene_type:complete